MVLSVVGSDSQRMPPVFIPEGLRVNAAVYQDILTSKVLPWLHSTYSNINFVFQQDLAPAHKAKTTVALLSKNLGKDGFWPPEFWPPNSPDLNLLDYFVWSAVEKESNKTSHPNTEGLKRAIIKA